MTPTAYIQAGTVKGYLSESCARAAADLTRRGYRVIPFARNKLPPTVTPDTPVKGDTGAVKAIYEWTFKTPYPNVDIPTALKPLAHRRVWKTTLGVLRARERAHRDSTREIFVKPLNEAKAFHAMSFRYAASGLCLFPDDYPILAQEYLHFLREERFFIGPRGVRKDPAQHHELRAYAEKAYQAWKAEAPGAYVLDVGWCGKGHPAVVEVNSVLTAGRFNLVTNPGALLIAAWKSYAHYAEHGTFR